MKCPHCCQIIDMMTMEMDQDWRKIIDLRVAFDKQGDLVWEYCHLFGVTPLDARRKKLLRLLEEVGALFAQKKFKWKKATYEISEKGIIEGLKVTCNANLTTPIQDHNYLRAVLASISMEEQKERRTASDKDLKSREQRAKSGEKEIEQRAESAEHRAKSEEKLSALSPTLYAEERGDELLSPEENRRRAAELANRIGRNI